MLSGNMINQDTVRVVQKTPGSLLALDYGKKIWGVAFSPPERTVSVPLLSIHRKNYTEDMNKLISIYRNEMCVFLIIGFPLGGDGRENKQTQRVLSFCQDLKRMHKKLDIILQDERFTSQESERYMSHIFQKRRRKNVKDSVAASLILRSFLCKLTQTQYSTNK